MTGFTTLDYGQLAKGGFVLGLLMIVTGASGEWAIHSHLLSLPAWEDALFFDLEVLGILVFLLSPITFGIVLPLVEN